MLSETTVFIIGAGAGFDIKMPMGTKLAQDISNLLRFKVDGFGRLDPESSPFVYQLRHKFSGSNKLAPHAEACRVISRGITELRSIDRYIDTHGDNKEIETCGKASIVYSILKSEKCCDFYVSDRFPSDTIPNDRAPDSWYRELSNMIFEGVSRNNVDSVFNNVSIISFNYDRCLEHYLISSLQLTFNINRSHAESLVSEMNIYHPYGTVGPLINKKDVTGIPFGFNPDELDVFLLSQRIRTFTERYEDSEQISVIKNAVHGSENIVFLGFGFHQQNLDLISPAQPPYIDKNIFATGMLIPHEASEKIKRRIACACIDVGFSSDDVERVILGIDVDCCNLLKKYRHHLTA